MEINEDLSNYDIIDNNYILLKELGSGASCNVYLSRSLQDNRNYALKILKNELQSFSTDLETLFDVEINNLRKINHQNVIRIIEGEIGNRVNSDGSSEQVKYIVLELASNGELFDYICFPGKGFDEYIARYIFSQILDGIEGCHKSGVSHRDLKTENIILTDNWIIKIADFGFATLLEGKKGNGLLTTPLGTRNYAAPEILLNRPYKGDKADIFSIGVILFVLVTAKIPFLRASSTDQFYRNFILADPEGYWDMISPKMPNLKLSEELRNLINLIFSFSPQERPSIQEIRNSAWMNYPTATYPEFIIEMQNRKKIVESARRIEFKKKFKDVEKSNKDNKNLTNRAYRCDNDEDINDSIVSLDKIERKVKAFFDGGNPYKIIITKEEDPNIVFQNLIEIFLGNKIVEVSEENYSMTVKSTDGGIEFDAVITKDENNLILEMIKKSGDKMLFYEEFIALCCKLSQE